MRVELQDVGVDEDFGRSAPDMRVPKGNGINSYLPLFTDLQPITKIFIALDPASR